MVSLRDSYNSPKEFASEFVDTYSSDNESMQTSRKAWITEALEYIRDEGISIKDNKQADYIKKIMEEAIKLEIDNKVDYEFGPNWGNIKQEKNYGYNYRSS